MADKYFVNVAVGADTDVECPVKFTGETKALGAMAFLDVDDLNLGTVASADKAANVAAETTADGSDADTTQALANALKVKVNAILTALKTAGIMIDDT